jgi:glycogen debranching enzyme
MRQIGDLGPLGEVTCVKGETFVVSGPQGDVQRGGDQGVYVRDTRVLDRLVLLVDGAPPRPLAGRAVAGSQAVFHAYVPRSDDLGVDPTLLVTRRRVVDGSLHEEVEIDNRTQRTRTVWVELVCGTDFAYIFDVKHARQLPASPPVEGADELTFRREGSDELVVIRPTADGEVDRDRIRWSLVLLPGASRRVCIDVEVTDVYGASKPLQRCEAFVGQPQPEVEGPGPDLSCSDVRVVRLVRRSLQDLQALEVRDPLASEDRFCAAGSPWYLTLFGRDALWTAFMALPYDLELAAGTLRALARRQGQRVDDETEEAPGKILHEIRRGSLAYRGDLPPNYYGTIDATPLFVMLLHEAWRWGLPAAEVEALLPNLEAALTWMDRYGDPDGDGFVEYLQQGDRGLVNQGWKDSHDGVQFADGRIAQPPIALVEVQGYAYAAALRGAELLDRFGRPGAEGWRIWAARLRSRFQDRFWLEDELGPYLAVAVDGQGRAVDSVTSNMGHVLSSGLLDPDQARTVARRLADPTMSSGWGLRTMATSATGFNPLSYHGGSVWPHDTAIAAWGCAEAGERDASTALIRGLVAAGPFFRYRLPELFAGLTREPGGFPVPYPAACRPQAWSAAAALLLVRACLRPRPAVPDGQLTLAPLWPPPFRRLELRDVPLAGGTVDLVLDEDAGVHHELRGTDLEVTWELEARSAGAASSVDAELSGST